MKYLVSMIAGLILFLAFLPAEGICNDTPLKAKVEALYAKADQALKSKDLPGCMAFLAKDYEHVYLGINRDRVLNFLKDIFEGYDELRIERRFLEITRSGNWIKVICDNKVEGKSRRDGWSIISQDTVIDLLMQEGNSLKIARSTQTDKLRLASVSGRTYKDSQTGFSFIVPKGWEILPTVEHPNIQGAVFILAPDGSSAAMLGYLKAPGVNAQQAAEGDEAVAKIFSNPRTYKLVKSGPIHLIGRQGYEIESEFYISRDRERHRRRVYYNANGLLYVLCFDSMPSKQWNEVKDGYQSILDSIK